LYHGLAAVGATGAPAIVVVVIVSLPLKLRASQDQLGRLCQLELLGIARFTRGDR
jgi:hypothetical protein